MNKKTIFIVLTIVLILAGVAAGVYLVQQSAEIRERAAPATTLSLTASSQSVQIDQNFTVNVEVDTSQNVINGVEMYINFDSSKLEALDANPGSFFTSPAEIGPNIDNTLGTIYYVVYPPTSATAQQGQGIIATISFRAKEAGSTTISIGPNSLVSSGKDSDGGLNILLGTNPVTITVLGDTIPTATPISTPVASPTPTEADSDENDDGLGGATTPTPTNVPSPTPTQSIGGTADTPTPTQAIGSPTPTPEIPPIPDSGISLPTLAGIIFGVLIITGALFLAL